MTSFNVYLGNTTCASHVYLFRSQKLNHTFKDDNSIPKGISFRVLAFTDNLTLITYIENVEEVIGI